MAAPLLPHLFPRPPLGPPPPPHHQLCFPPPSPMAPWDNLPPPPVQFFPVPLHPPAPCPPIIGAVYNFVPGPGPAPGFRGRGGGYPQRGYRSRGRGGGARRGEQAGAQGGHHVEKKFQKPAEFSCKVCNKDYRSEESYQIHMQSHQKVVYCFFALCDCAAYVPNSMYTNIKNTEFIKHLMPRLIPSFQCCMGPDALRMHWCIPR